MRLAAGLDFGTESARLVLVDVASGEEAATEVYPYPHGVLTRALPDGTPLGADWALQHPGDYLEAAEHHARVDRAVRVELARRAHVLAANQHCVLRAGARPDRGERRLEPRVQFRRRIEHRRIGKLE